MRMRPSDSNSNNRAEKCANQEKWFAGRFNPISGSGAMSEVEELSVVIYSVSFFPRVILSFFHSTLRKFRTIIDSNNLSDASSRSVKKTNNAIKSITINDRIVLSARWIPISWSLRYARSWVKSLLRQTWLHRRYECLRYFPDYPMPPADTLRHFRERKAHIAASLSTVFFFFFFNGCTSRGVYGGGFRPFSKTRKPDGSVDPGCARPRNGDSRVYTRVYI